ncbi:hypothetical protein IIA28_14475, partial [candidate division KSB1 bacterium]|nr:hypothetical protein [candidate division KSB1 bacterium]
KIPQTSRPLFPISKPGFDVQENVYEPPKFAEAEIPKQKPEMRPYERLERTAIRDERVVLKHKKVEETIYLRVDRFRDILTSTNTIKSNLKIASDSIVKLNEIDVNRDKVFEKWRNVLVDLQKKLIFVDKTLFKR